MSVLDDTIIDFMFHLLNKILTIVIKHLNIKVIQRSSKALLYVFHLTVKNYVGIIYENNAIA